MFSRIDGCDVSSEMDWRVSRRIVRASSRRPSLSRQRASAMATIRLVQRGRRGQDADLVDRVDVGLAREQRLGERAFRGRAHRRRGAELLGALVVLVDALQPQAPAEQHLDAVDQLQRDVVRARALADRRGGPADHLFGRFVDAELVEHQPAVDQRRGEQPVPGAQADLPVGDGGIVQDGQGPGDLGERGVLLRGDDEAPPAQRVRVGPQQGDAVPPGVREHLVEPGFGLGGQALGGQPGEGGRTQQLGHEQWLTAPLGLVEQLVHHRDDLELLGVLVPLDRGTQLPRAPDDPGVGHLGQRGPPGRHRVGRLFGQRQPPGVVGLGSICCSAARIRT
jgi:hypothetical protein